MVADVASRQREVPHPPRLTRALRVYPRAERAIAPMQPISAVARFAPNRDEVRSQKEIRVEEFFQALGTIGLIFLIVVGVLAGLLASAAQGGRNKLRNIVVGVIGALVLPLLVAILATGVLAAGGIILILVVALVGAVAVLAIVRLLFR